LAGMIGMAVSGIKQILDLVSGNTPADKGFLGNMLAILEKIAKVIDKITGGISGMITSVNTEVKAAVLDNPTMLNVYNPSAKNRSGMEAAKDIALGVNRDLALSMVQIAMFAKNLLRDDMLIEFANTHSQSAPQAAGGINQIVPTAGQRVNAQTNGAISNSFNTKQDIKITAPAKEHAGIIRGLKAKPLGGMAPALAGGMQ